MVAQLRDHQGAAFDLVDHLVFKANAARPETGEIATYRVNGLLPVIVWNAEGGAGAQAAARQIEPIGFSILS